MVIYICHVLFYEKILSQKLKKRILNNIKPTPTNKLPLKNIETREINSVAIAAPFERQNLYYNLNDFFGSTKPKDITTSSIKLYSLSSQNIQQFVNIFFLSYNLISIFVKYI